MLVALFHVKWLQRIVGNQPRVAQARCFLPCETSCVHACCLATTITSWIGRNSVIHFDLLRFGSSKDSCRETFIHCIPAAAFPRIGHSTPRFQIEHARGHETLHFGIVSDVMSRPLQNCLIRVTPAISIVSTILNKSNQDDISRPFLVAADTLDPAHTHPSSVKNKPCSSRHLCLVHQSCKSTNTFAHRH